jgi:phosphoglycerate dehydrogenase-like enzyme
LVTLPNWQGNLLSGGYENLLDHNPGIEEIVDVSDQYPLDEAQMRQVIADRGPFHGCLVGEDTFNAAVIDALADRVVGDPYPHVAVHKCGVGHNDIDKAAARRRGVPVSVTRTPEFSPNQDAVAELTLALMLATLRHIVPLRGALQAGDWNKRPVGRDVIGLTLGLIGVGAIGKEVCRRLLTWGVQIAVYDPFLSGLDQYVREYNAAGNRDILGRKGSTMSAFAALDEMLPKCDVVSLHVPLTENTAGMVDAAFLRKMKEPAILINPSRGGLLVEEDVVAMYRGQKIGGVAVDVLTREFDKAVAEPPPLLQLLQQDAPIIITPHVGALTEQTMPRQVDWTQRNALSSLGLIDGQVQMWLPEAAAPWQ